MVQSDFPSCLSRALPLTLTLKSYILVSDQIEDITQITLPSLQYVCVVESFRHGRASPPTGATPVFRSIWRE